MAEVVVLGASGFVGSTVVAALRAAGADVTALSAPRLRASSSPESAHWQHEMDRVGTACAGATAVVNCAGIADAAGIDEDAMIGANARLPELVAQATDGMGVRLVHVSSCAVQGNRAVLDESDETSPFSAYSRSKSDGERRLRGFGHVVIYRPPGVHDAGRAMTRALARLAASPLSSVAAGGKRNAAQAQLANVASAIVFLALTPASPPRIVLHPSEGLTTHDLLLSLGGREPRHVPLPLARGLVTTLTLAGRRSSRLAAHSRRLETMWLGQCQGPSWLQTQGWEPPVALSGWRDIGRAARSAQHQQSGEAS